MTTVEAPTLEERAREALALLIERQGLPTPPRWSWSHLTASLSITFDSDADVETWAKALLRKPAVSFTGWDVEPGCWSVIRTCGFDIPRWMGVGVSLSVRHNEHRRVPGGAS